jgi:hypothetical protein
MQIELRPGSGVAALVLSLSTLLALEKKGIDAADHDAIGQHRLSTRREISFSP